MSTVRDWLALTRVHTASLTIPGVLLGALATGNRDPFLITMLGVWALLFHGNGFLLNNLMDLPADARDPHKQHFPLVSGAISERWGWILWWASFIYMMSIGVALATGFAPLVSSILALAFLILASFAGIRYNVISKRSLWAPLWISLSFASLPLFAFFVAGGDWRSPIGWWLGGYAFALMLSQIAWAGYLKDLGTDEVNLLKKLGCYTLPGGTIFTTKRAQNVGFVLRTLVLIPAMLSTFVGVFPVTSVSPLSVVAFMLLSFGILFTWQVTADSWGVERNVALRWMSLGEVLAFLFLLMLLTPMLGVAWTTSLAVGSVVYFLIANQIIWGSWTPRV